MKITWITITLLLASAVSNAATMTLVKQPSLGDGRDRWLITSISATETDLVQPKGWANNWSRIALRTDGRGGGCGPMVVHDAQQCLSKFSSIGYCLDRSSAYADLMGYVGNGVHVAAGEKPTYADYGCGSPDYTARFGWYIPTIGINLVEAPASCTVSTAQMTLAGRVGARLTGTTDLKIHCDSPASLRLTLENDGVVPVGGSGEVRLTFQKNDTAVLAVPSTTPLVSIDGELTKSPKTAGTYQGSTVVRIDIL